VPGASLAFGHIVARIVAELKLLRGCDLEGVRQPCAWICTVKSALPNQWGFPRKRQLLESGLLFHWPLTVDSAGPLSDMPVYHSRSRWQPSLASVGRRLATRRELLRDNFRVAKIQEVWIFD
jgi:hypothetical protein